MKKYMTIAALLAAGSVFANAELLWTMDFGSEYANGYQLTTAEGVSYTPTIWDVSGYTNEDGVITAGNHRPHLENGDTGVNWADGFIFTIDVELPASGDITASNGWPVFVELSGGATSLRFGPYVEAGNYVDLDGTLTKAERNQFVVENGGSYMFTLIVENHVASLKVGDQLIASGTLADDASASINNITLGGNSGSSYRINSTVHSISMSSLSTIPEPSAFGLLAGVGALALVAVRRRRSK